MSAPYQPSHSAPNSARHSSQRLLAPTCVLLATLFASTACVSHSKKETTAQSAKPKPATTIASKPSAAKPAEAKPPVVAAVVPSATQSIEGTWFEVARLNQCNQRGLTRVNFTFTSLSDNRWATMRRGWRNEAGAWEVTSRKTLRVPKATPAASISEAFRRAFPVRPGFVSVDQTNRYALVCSRNHRDFWILSKDQTPSNAIIETLLTEAKSKGFPIEEALFLQYQ